MILERCSLSQASDLAPVLARYEEQLAHQQALSEKLQFLSPALLAETAFAESAGTGLPRHHCFFAQAMAHHAELRAFFDPVQGEVHRM